MLYLASKSPRRQQLLEQIQQAFELIHADVDELIEPLERAEQFVARMAKEKAEAGYANVMTQDKNALVLGSDTIVVCQGQVLGKPKDAADALSMLQLLSDNDHQVMTAIALKSSTHLYDDLVITKVFFRALTEQEILQYWQSGEPQDKAGSYAIQGVGGKFVKRIEGSYSSVVGLPLYETEQLLMIASNNI